MYVNLTTKFRQFHTKFHTFKDNKESSLSKSSKKNFVVPKVFLIFRGPSTTFLINWFLVQEVQRDTGPMMERVPGLVSQ